MLTKEQSFFALNQRNNQLFWLSWLIIIGLVIFVFRVSISEMFTVWIDIEEYSHGFFIPCISFYFIWLRRAELTPVTDIKSSLFGLVLVVIGMVVFIIAGLAAIRAIEQYAFLLFVYGLFAIAFGTKGLRTAAVPLIFLQFMVPFPNFILNSLSLNLQLMSSALGVAFIRSCNIMVYLEGNVIDLGVYKLQVIDACSGLRYMFPLSSLAFLCAYLFKGPFWQKTLIFLSSLPITVFMNSFRIGVIGVLVDHWGTEMAEGFLHDFEGWAVFVLCMLLLFIEMWLLTRISGRKLAMNELVQIPEEWLNKTRAVPLNLVVNKTLGLVLLLLVIGGGLSENYRERVDTIPQRKVFLNFPLQIADWQGYSERIEEGYLSVLKLTDYVLVNFINKQHHSVSFYTAYYQSQRKDATIHSPRSCLPGDGWQISDYKQLEFPNLSIEGVPLSVNRAVIEKGEIKQLAYFWFQQRGRVITNEYILKWFIFYDAITMNRTDGALVRLVTPVAVGENIEAADQRLQEFLKDALPLLPTYVPGKSAEAAGYTETL